MTGKLNSFAQIKLTKFKSFIPVQYELLDSASGNLNKDAYPDLILILEAKESNMNSDANRPLILLAGTATGGYKLIARNDNVVLCKGCGGMLGDPYQAITIKNGYFSIEHYGGSGWRWTKIITFKFDPKSSTFKLHRDGGESYHVDESKNIRLVLHNQNKYGKLQFVNYNNHDD